MTPAASPRRPRLITPCKLTPTDEELLLAYARYQYMTVEHWVRWFEDDGKRRYLQRRSLALSENDYLIRLSITPLGGRGKGRSIFTHGTAGKSFAQSLGKRVGVTISGGNIGLDGFCQIINQRDA
jgi:hypothetical protein